MVALESVVIVGRISGKNKTRLVDVLGSSWSLVVVGAESSEDVVVGEETFQAATQPSGCNGRDMWKDSRTLERTKKWEPRQTLVRLQERRTQHELDMPTRKYKKATVKPLGALMTMGRGVELREKTPQRLPNMLHM